MRRPPPRRPSLLIRSGLISARGCSLKTGIAKTEKQSASGGTRARSEQGPLIELARYFFTTSAITLLRVPELISEEVARKSGYKLDQKAPIATVAELPNYDAIIFGSGTRFSVVTSQMRNFLDQTGSLWMTGAPAKWDPVARPLSSFDASIKFLPVVRSALSTGETSFASSSDIQDP
jgi:hypothetical protein